MGMKSLWDNFYCLKKRCPEGAQYLCWLIKRTAEEERKKAKKKEEKAASAKRYRDGHQDSLNAKKREWVFCSACGERLTQGSFYNHRKRKHGNGESPVCVEAASSAALPTSPVLGMQCKAHRCL